MSIAITVIQTLPKIISLVKFVEETATQVAQEQQQNPTGSFKLSLVKVLLEDAYNTTHPTIAFDQIWPIAEKVINMVVAFLNERGVFKKTTQPAILTQQAA